MNRFRCHFVRTVLFCLALTICTTDFPVHADELDEARRHLGETYRRQLADLSKKIDLGGNAALAQNIRDWLPPRDGVLVLYDPNDAKSDTSPPNARFVAIRNSQADALFDLGKQAARASRSALAFQLASDAVRENPGHVDARHTLGFEQVNGRWLTRYAVRQESRGYMWHDSFGWIKSKDAAHYEAGERPRGRRWIKAVQDAHRRSAIDDGWIVRTSHFSVTTNHSLEGGVRLAKRLESLHSLWQQLFAGYYLSKRDVRELFASGKNPRRKTKPFQVRYYRSREGYYRALVQKQPQITKTLGIYFARDRLAHFFAGKDQHRATIVHEATHQFFQESGRTVRNVGALDNFWIVEGVATYMESLEERGGGSGGEGQVSGVRGQATGENEGFRYYTVGDLDAGRVPAARERLLDDGFYVPFAELVQLGKDDIQHRADIAKLYSQIAGQTTFLMHAEGDRYRDALVDYLIAVYADRADANTLSELTGKSYAQLDRDYRQWLEALR